jgi:anti-sigma B factor antagonist
MFEIEAPVAGQVLMRGRLDAVQAPKAEAFLDAVEGEIVIDLSGLEFISSAGLGVLLRKHKQLSSKGSALQLVKVSPHIGDIFKYSGFDRLFKIQ